jgi:hypothetical protein
MHGLLIPAGALRPLLPRPFPNLAAERAFARYFAFACLPWDVGISLLQLLVPLLQLHKIIEAALGCSGGRSIEWFSGSYLHERYGPAAAATHLAAAGAAASSARLAEGAAGGGASNTCAAGWALATGYPCTGPMVAKWRYILSHGPQLASFLLGPKGRQYLEVSHLAAALLWLLQAAAFLAVAGATLASWWRRSGQQATQPPPLAALVPAASVACAGCAPSSTRPAGAPADDSQGARLATSRKSPSRRSHQKGYHQAQRSRHGAPPSNTTTATTTTTATSTSTSTTSATMPPAWAHLPCWAPHGRLLLLATTPLASHALLPLATLLQPARPPHLLRLTMAFAHSAAAANRFYLAHTLSSLLLMVSVVGCGACPAAVTLRLQHVSAPSTVRCSSCSTPPRLPASPAT